MKVQAQVCFNPLIDSKGKINSDSHSFAFSTQALLEVHLHQKKI